ncbi:hypothetical protein ACJX0J_036382, partial [Zea mays]
MHVCIYVYLPGTVVVFQISCFSFNDFDKDISFLYEFTTHILIDCCDICVSMEIHVPKSALVFTNFFSALAIKIGDLGLCFSLFMLVYACLIHMRIIYEIVGMDYWHE